MNKNKTYSKKVTTKSRFSQSRKSITSIQKGNFKANTVETKPKHIRFKETRKESSPEINIKIISNGDNEESDIKNEKYRSSGTSRKLKETIIDTLESLSSLNITLSGKNKNRKFKTNIKKSNNDSRKLSIQNTILKNKNNYSSKASKKLKTLQPFSSKHSLTSASLISSPSSTPPPGSLYSFLLLLLKIAILPSLFITIALAAVLILGLFIST